jgi:hypothetical protein
MACGTPCECRGNREEREDQKRLSGADVAKHAAESSRAWPRRGRLPTGVHLKLRGEQFPALVKAGCREAAGRFVQENEFLDQHHPGGFS